MPERIQRKRTAGWKMPPNTVSVARPGRWGNPAVVGDYFMVGDPDGARVFRMSWCRTTKEHAANDDRFTHVDSAATAVALFRRLVEAGYFKNLNELRGKNLACFCKLGEPCHADVLLEVANGKQV